MGEVCVCVCVCGGGGVYCLCGLRMELLAARSALRSALLPHLGCSVSGSITCAGMLTPYKPASPPVV
ncbi:hypothetical protein D4764_07G0010470 [Takifugu flavidus]|uniref:Uncharacterized protein n=1 Tax=Takifugu flavidus TaxID=433684 RepID=A0A5C6MVD9_9TELE|nr:hypothetical protein D4764_07G0010470 [Takifugu flavidus]